MTGSVNLNYGYNNVSEYSAKNQNENFKVKTFVCDTCGMSFFRKASLTVHINSHTMNNSNMEDDREEDEKKKENVCNICFKKFTAKKNLLKHLREVHKNYKEAERMVVKKIKCPERDCKFMCRMMKGLRDHIEECHNIKILKDTLQFPSESAFLKWKKEEESNTVSWFVTGRKKTTLTDGTKKQIMCCHRTGHYNPKGFGKYRMRSVGSCKIGVTCPAAMEITELVDGQLSVVYYKTHLGHMQDVVYLKLSREERERLAEKIEQGFTFDAILEDVKEANNFKDEKKKRIHLLSKKDLYSIMRTANNNSFRKIKKECNEKNTSEKTLKTKEPEPVSDDSFLVKNSGSGKPETHQENFAFFPGQNVMYPDGNAIENSSALVSQKIGRDPNISQASGEEVASQIVILSPDIDYTSVAEIILLAGETPSQTLLPSPNKLPYEQIKTEQASRPADLSLEEKNRINRTNLRLQLKDKIDRISEFLPKSEFLTPKQFDLINAKLDGILNVFNEANSKAKTRRQNLNKRRGIKKPKPLEGWGRIEEVNGIVGSKIDENLPQQVYQSPLIYAVYN